MFNMTHFDGYNISWSLMHPFKEKVPISGTDAFQNAPALSRTDNVSVFISNLYRVGDLNFN